MDIILCVDFLLSNMNDPVHMAEYSDVLETIHVQTYY